MRLVLILLMSADLLAGVTSADSYAGHPTNAADQIDAIIRLDLKKHELQPNPPVTDVQFVRRVYLDVIGRVPTDKELEVSTPTPAKTVEPG